MALLGVNIDHVATVRQARRADEPDPVLAAGEAILGGADIITAHLREDRRHINDRDVERLAGMLTGAVRLNLEMAATDEMVGIARGLRRMGPAPHEAALVPEGRAEVTTEGGLNVAGSPARMRDVVARLHDAGILVSAFIDAEPEQIAAAAAAGFDMCEVHTGPYAAAFAAAAGDLAAAPVAAEFAKVADAGRRIIGAGMRSNAGHALNYLNVGPVAALPGLAVLHIGHSIVSRAVFVGMQGAVREMKRAMGVGG